MGIPKEPKPVKLFIALLSNHEALFPQLEGELAASFGAVDSASGILPWTLTDYYQEEMGSRLLRKFISFISLVSPEKLAELKLITQGLEANHQWVQGERRGRRANIDPGYLDANKVVLATTKDASHRVYLHSGIYAEAALRFHRGSFQPFDYTYPDYRWPETLSFFSSLRSLYLSQLKVLG